MLFGEHQTFGNVVLTAGMRVGGTRAILEGNLDLATTEFLVEKGITELVIGTGYWILKDNNQSKDNHKKTIDFAREIDADLSADLTHLSEITTLKFLSLNLKVFRGIESIETLANLEQLELASIVDSQQIDFARMKALRAVSLENSSGAETVFQCKQLETILLWNVKTQDLQFLKDLTDLRSLEICHANALRALHGLPTKSLRNLTLYHNAKLEEFDPISNCDKLQSLNIVSCRKLGNLEKFSKLTSLEDLVLDNCGEITSLRPLVQLPLKSLVFPMTKIIDGDISCLTEIKSLKDLRFMNMRHYNMTDKEWFRKRWPRQSQAEAPQI